jgi:hypothetical protein
MKGTTEGRKTALKGVKVKTSERVVVIEVPVTGVFTSKAALAFPSGAAPRPQYRKSQNHAFSMAMALRAAKELALDCGYTVEWGIPVAWTPRHVAICHCKTQPEQRDDVIALTWVDGLPTDNMTIITYEEALNRLPHATEQYLHIGHPLPHRARRAGWPYGLPVS